MITKKYEQIKQIRFDHIDANRMRAQARHGDASQADIKEMASSIETIGLQEPISIEPPRLANSPLNSLSSPKVNKSLNQSINPA